MKSDQHIPNKQRQSPKLSNIQEVSEKYENNSKLFSLNAMPQKLPFGLESPWSIEQSDRKELFT